MRTTIAAVAAMTALGTVAVGCSDNERPLPRPMSVTLPSVASRSRSEILAALCRGAEPPALQVSASAFELGSATPRSSDPQWDALLGQLRTLHDELATTADSSSCCLAPIRIDVTGYTDSTGSLATNQALSLARAEATKVAVVGVGFDPATVTAIPGGVGGNTASDRRVSVQVRPDPTAGRTCQPSSEAGGP